MLRFSEIGLFLAPLAAFAGWWLLSARAGRRVVWAAVVAFLLFLASAVWLGLVDRLNRTEVYVPAHMEDGRIVPGHGVPRS